MNSDDDVLGLSTKLTYMIGTASVDELHEAVVEVVRAATVGKDDFFRANDAAWKAIDEGLEFFKTPRSKSEINRYMETNKV